MRILQNHISAFSMCDVPSHVEHQYSTESSKTSRIVCVLVILYRKYTKFSVYYLLNWFDLHVYESLYQKYSFLKLYQATNSQGLRLCAYAVHVCVAFRLLPL